MKRPFAAFTGLGVAVPSGVVTNADLEKTLDTSDQWIVERTGIRERHRAGPEDTVASLSLEAARIAMARAGVGPLDLGAIVLGTATPDRLLPSTACDLQALDGGEQRGGVRHLRCLSGLHLRHHGGRGADRRRADRHRPGRRGREAHLDHRPYRPLHRDPLRRRRRGRGTAADQGRQSRDSCPPSSSRTGAWRPCCSGPAAGAATRSAKRSFASAASS